MNKCIKCGANTKNEYECYSAYEVTKSEQYISMESVQIRTLYSDFKHHQNYVCGSCIVGEFKSKFLNVVDIWNPIVFIIGCLIGIIMYVFGSNRQWYTGDYASMATFGLLFVCGVSLLFLYLFVLNILSFFKITKTIKNDKFYKEGSTGLIRILREGNEYKGRSFFTPEEYKELK